MLLTGRALVGFREGVFGYGGAGGMGRRLMTQVRGMHGASGQVLLMNAAPRVGRFM
jgi:hypothetical protein